MNIKNSMRKTNRTIHLPVKTYEMIKLLKEKHNFSSFNAVIKALINNTRRLQVLLDHVDKEWEKKKNEKKIQDN